MGKEQSKDKDIGPDVVVDYEAFEDRRRARVFQYEYRLPAANEQGHSSTVATRIPRSLKAVITSLIQKEKYPYSTDSELVRHAIYEHVHKLIEIDSGALTGPGMTHWAAVISLEKILNEEEQLRESTAQLRRLRDQALKCHSKKDAARLRRIHDEALGFFAQVQDEYWQEHALKILSEIDEIISRAE